MSYTVMVVDDSEIIRSMVVRCLNMSGLPLTAVIEAENGRTALQKLAEHWIDIVLTDIHMPLMSGIDLVNAMQAGAEYRRIPVVIISTEGSSMLMEELRQKGIKGFLRKPFTPEKIRDTVINILGAWNA